MILKEIFLAMNVLAWFMYMDSNGVKNKNIVKHPYRVGIQKL